MKVLLKVFLVSFVASASSFNLSYVLPNTDAWYVPNFLNDTYSWITRTLVQAELDVMAQFSDRVTYYLYTQDNPNMSQIISDSDSSTLRKSHFDPTNPTRIIIHGFQSSAEQSVCTLLRDAYFKTGPSNIVCVGWATIAQKTYPTARYVAPSVGRDLAEFIHFLSTVGQMKMENLIVVGHSLGAHIAGIAGKSLHSYNLKIPVILGCDPAMPLFNYDDCSSRLCESDASFVETIQTCGGRLGFLRPIGSGSYYPNGGVSQPGCGVDAIGSCSHSRSYEYLAEAIDFNDFPTMQCKDYKNAVKKDCGKEFSSVKMASRSSYRAEGVFYVPVNSKSKFGKGAKN